MDRVENVAAGDTAKSATWNGVQDQAASLYQVAWSWRGRRPTLACDGSNLIVGGHKGCSIGSTQAGSVLMPADSGTTLALSGLTGSTWYYLYAYDDSSSPGYEWSTTAPDSSLSHKTGDETRAYLGCFYATGASTMRAFRAIDGCYLYDHSNVGACLALSGGTAGSFTDVSLAALMPPHARCAHLYTLVTSGAPTDAARIRPNGSANAGTPIYAYATALWCETDSTQAIEYQKDAANTVSIYCIGFAE